MSDGALARVAREGWLFAQARQREPRIDAPGSVMLYCNRCRRLLCPSLPIFSDYTYDLCIGCAAALRPPPPPPPRDVAMDVACNGVTLERMRQDALTLPGSNSSGKRVIRFREKVLS